MGQRDVDKTFWPVKFLAAGTFSLVSSLQDF